MDHHHYLPDYQPKSKQIALKEDVSVDLPTQFF
jgi:hypothetical protein